MLRSPWFWIVILLIAIGVALTVALGVFYWLVAAIVAAALVIALVLLVAAYAVGRAEPLQVPALREVPPSERIPVIYDCDVTLGRLFCEVDDGLALLYLQGEPRVDLLGVTTTYGNASVQITTRVTRRLLADVGYSHIPVKRGAASPAEGAEGNEAARYLLDTVSARPGEVAIVATGAMTNLWHAATLDVDFFKKLRGLYLMGGVSEPLTWNKHRLAELNFTLDPEAAYQALHADCPVTVATGQAGLTAIFRAPRLAALQTLKDPVSRLIVRKSRLWLGLMRVWFRDGGYAMWDSVAALALTHPELLELEQVHVTSTRGDLRTGRLVTEPGRHGPVKLVRAVRDLDGFVTTHFAVWHRLGQQIGGRSNP